MNGTILGSFTGAPTASIRPYLIFSTVENTAGNYSTITASLYFQRYTSLNQVYNLNSTHTCNSTIDTTQSQTTQNYDLRAPTSLQLVRTVILNIDHLLDGTKSAYIGFNGDTKTIGTYNFGETITLPAIPRNASISDSSIDFTIGNSIPINISNPANLYLKALTYINGVLIQSATLGQVTSATLTFNSTEIGNMYAQTPNSISISAYVRIATYSDGGYSTQVGINQDKTCTASVDTTINKPVFTTYTVAEVSQTISNTDKYSNVLSTNTTNTLLGSTAKMIKGYSKLRATITTGNKAVAQNSATMSKYTFQDDIQTTDAAYSSGSTVTIDINNATNINTTVTATDSRSLATQVAEAISLISNYVAPTLYNMTLTRDNSIDAPVTLAFSGSYYNKYFSSDTTSNPGSGTLNAIIMHYRFKNSLNDFVTQNGTVTITIASPGVLTKTAHGLATGDVVFLTTTIALPTGLTANTTYYVIVVDANTFKLATTYANALAGTAINTSGSQSGVHTLNIGIAWTSITPTDTAGVLTYSAHINGDLGASGFNINKSYTIEIRAYDKVSNVIINQTLNVGTPLLHYTKNGIAINGKYSTVTGGVLQVNGDITLGNYKGSIIASTYGGTGNGFTKFSGPATAEKTFTLPNASAVILTDNAAITVAQGGTGAATLTGLLKGNGTSAVTTVTAPAGAVVGTTDTQTLSAKTLTTPVIQNVTALDSGSVSRSVTNIDGSNYLVLGDANLAGVLIKNNIRCNVFRSTNQSVASGDTIVFDSETYDDGNNHNAATGIFTAPVAGVYLITGQIGYGTTISGKRYGFQIAKNGTAINATLAFSTGTTELRVAGCVQVKLAANDTIKMLASHDVGSAINTDNGAANIYMQVTLLQ